MTFFASQLDITRAEGGIVGIDSGLDTAVLAMLGHDLRQPLQLIRGAHDLLARTVWSEADRVQLSLIDIAVTRISSLLNQVIDALRLQLTSNNHHCQPVSLRPLFKELVSEFAETAASKGITLRVIPTSTVVSSERILLSAIMRNLVRNAIQYSPSGGRILLACRRRGAEARIEIRDSGIGIAPDQVTRIFRPFYRADSTQAEGIGLGLFIANQAALFLGHRIQVRSAIGRGSCFTVGVSCAFGREPC
jgi:two-component system, OmpR family, phosphate regulon sensor histidine kinase PhoR